ncbi:MAG: hypothetical protein LBK66_02580 [Spirochaetaceae bacterium]|jgi:hypothetical protein|nr:hypothetical protein [Spirochaetaceae bacterium]
MKKIISIISVFLINFCFLSLLYGQNDNTDNEEIASEGADLSTGKRESRRFFELGIANIALNNVFNGVDLFGLFGGDSSRLDMGKFDSIAVNLNFFTNPLSVKFPIANLFVLDVFTGADIDVSMDMPKKTIDALKEIESLAKIGEISDFDFSELKEFIKRLQEFPLESGMFAGASAFMEIGMGGSKTLMDGRLWLRAAPSMYFTLLYMKRGGISLKGYQNGTKYGLAGEGAMHMYSAWDLNSGDINPFSSPGLDLTLEALFALFPVLDTGVSISHIPLVPSTLKHRMTIDVSGLNMYVDTTDPAGSLMNFNVPDFESMITEGDSENKKVFRPVRFDFYALVKPFRSPVLVIRPNIGATANMAVSDTTLFNWGLKVQYNAPVIFSAFIGTGLTENIWAQQLGIILDLRVFELSISGALAGMGFVESWSAKGFGAEIGFKMGF